MKLTKYQLTDTLLISTTFTGCFLGAGYVSGQEVYQFFGAFGAKGMLGLVFAMAVIFVSGCMLTRLTMMTGDRAIDRAVVGGQNRVLLFAVGAAELLMMFGTYFVMIAGAGALIEQVTGLPYANLWGGFIYTVMLSALAILGLNGLVRIFSAAVPLLVIFTVLIGICSVVKVGGIPEFAEIPHTNPLLPNFVAGAFTFSCYNFFCCVGVMTPYGTELKSVRRMRVGIFFGVCFLFLVATGIILSINACPSAPTASLPILAAAEWIWQPLQYLFAALLFLAMTGAGLSCLLPTAMYFHQHFAVCEKHNVLTVCVISGVAFLLSCFGFADLVGTVFSCFGYISFFILLGVVRHYILVRRNKQK